MVLELKWVALISLIVQNSGLAIVMRYTLLMAAGDPEKRYITSTAVLTAEVLKLVISSFLCFREDARQNQTEFFRILNQEFIENKADFFKLMVPSFLYTLQNSLQYFSMSCLSAPVFQVLYQMKIITTALFSVLLLAKRISGLQWMSILALAVGVALVQLSQQSASEADKANSIAGLVSVMFCCLTSGFAGVYFELVLKASKASIWLRNIQLSVIGIIISGISCYGRDGKVIAERGFFAGYNSWVWTVVLLQAAGGLLVAMVVKYADNVLKGFATSLSIILSALVSAVYFHDIDINSAFVFGSLVVLVSVYLYGYQPAPAAIAASPSLPNPNNGGVVKA
jgi:UDP-sugar transporter A1/2/3